jgi:4-hydroxy-tetrahydrodipicolinate synthase
MGLCGGALRMPLTDMEPENVEKLSGAMKRYGIL